MSAGSATNGRSARGNGSNGEGRPKSFWHGLRRLFGKKSGDAQLLETIEEIIGEIQESESEDELATPIGDDERMMLSNILKLRHLTAYDVMVPRADITAVDLSVSLDELIATMSRAGHSRLPVYRETLDDVLGIVHIKDVLDFVTQDKPFELSDILRRIQIAAPSMRILDLLLEMRLSRVHMALVVDEYGGIDGLLTIEDLVEEIVGEIQDEHDVLQGPKLGRRDDGTVIADARATIEEFEELVGPVLSDEERDEDIDTLGGLLFYLVSRVPTRGELIEHPASGISFEILEADPRRVKRLRVRNLPATQSEDATDGE